MAKFITLGRYTAKGLGGFVNNPGKSKYYLLKQLESIISLNIKEKIK